MEVFGWWFGDFRDPLSSSSSGELMDSALSAIGGLNEHDFPFSLHDLLFPLTWAYLPLCESFLIAQQQYYALALLYQSKQLIRKALEVWLRLGTGEFRQKESAHGTASADASFILSLRFLLSFFALLCYSSHVLL